VQVGKESLNAAIQGFKIPLDSISKTNPAT